MWALCSASILANLTFTERAFEKLPILQINPSLQIGLRFLLANPTFAVNNLIISEFLAYFISYLRSISIFGQNDAKIRFCRRSSSCHLCSPGAKLAQSRDPPTSGASSPPAVQTGGPQRTSRDYSHDFCHTNISLYTSSWSLWETHSFIMKTYEVEDYTLLIRWMGFLRRSQSRHHLICKSVVLGSRHLGHRCTLCAFFQDELLTSITQLG